MPDHLLNPPAMPVGIVLAYAGGPAPVTSLPFSVVSLIFFLGWFYLSLYLAKQVDESPLVPNQYREALKVVSLFLGPLVFLILVLIEALKSEGAAEDKSLGGLLQRMQNAFGNIWRKGMKPAEPESTLQLFDSLGTELSEIYGHGDKAAAGKHILNLTVQIIENALNLRASDILIDPKDHASYLVRLRIDGMLRNVRELPTETSKAVINSVKAVSSMDIAERRRPQDGAFTAKRGEENISFRVATAGALNGEKISIRVLNQDAGKFTLTDAGIPERQRAVIGAAITKPSRMVLICGAPGSGKTTTLYSMLNQIDRASHNVITVEDPIEARLPEVSQLEINPKADITFAKALRSILRQDPDVICVGEIRDEETAEIALRAAQTGHLVLATIHCDSNATALIRLLDLGVSPMLMSSGLSLLISQRLMRKLCGACKRPAQLSPALIQEFRRKGINTQNIYEPVGCEICGGTGFYGRTAICDLLPITEEIRYEIAHDQGIAGKLRSEGEQKGRTNLRSEAITRVLAGITSLDELKRVVG